MSYWRSLVESLKWQTLPWFVKPSSIKVSCVKFSLLTGDLCTASLLCSLESTERTKGNFTTRWSEALSSSSSPPSSLVATHTTPTKWGTQIWRKGKSKKVYISYIKGLFAPTLRQELFRSPLQRSNQGWALLSLGYRFSYSRIIWHISYIVISRQYRDILYNISGQTVLVWKGWKGHLLFRFNSNTCPKLQWDKYMRMSQNAVYWIYVIFRLFKNMVYRNICPILYTYRSNPSKEYRSGVGPTTPTVQ